MDLGTGLALFGSAKLAEKILGPTAEYVGEGIRSFTERRAANVRRIFEKAERQLGPGLDEGGGVAPRVLSVVLNDGSFCDDELGAEYFGGLLAASRTEAMDDRALPYLRLVEDSSIQGLRMHYLFYSELRRLFLDVDRVSLSDHSARSEFRVYLPNSVIASVLAAEDRLSGAVVQDCTLSLSNHALIDSNWIVGDRDTLKGYGDEITEAGVVYRPSGLGSRLFLWVNGYPDAPVADLVSSHLNISRIRDLPIPEGAVALGLRDGGEASA